MARLRIPKGFVAKAPAGIGVRTAQAAAREA